MTMNIQQTLVGEFIEAPAWQTFGCVEDQRPASIGAEGTIEVLLCEYPDQPARLWRWYRLAPGEWSIA